MFHLGSPTAAAMPTPEAVVQWPKWHQQLCSLCSPCTVGSSWEKVWQDQWTEGCSFVTVFVKAQILDVLHTLNQDPMHYPKLYKEAEN